MGEERGGGRRKKTIIYDCRRKKKEIKKTNKRKNVDNDGMPLISPVNVGWTGGSCSESVLMLPNKS